MANPNLYEGSVISTATPGIIDQVMREHEAADIREAAEAAKKGDSR
jgi:hypothetical protein